MTATLLPVLEESIPSRPLDRVELSFASQEVYRHPRRFEALLDVIDKGFWRAVEQPGDGTVRLIVSRETIETMVGRIVHPPEP